MATRTVKSQTKFRETCDQLGRLARVSGPGAKLPTVVQMRSTFDVGVNTLMDALAELETQNVITRKHGSGIFVAPQIARTVALLCDPDIINPADSSPFWQMLIEKIRGRAEAEHETLEMHLLKNWGADGPFNASLRRDLTEHRVNGVIAIGFSKENAQQMARFGVPYVSYAGDGEYCVGSNAPDSVRRAVQHLHEHGGKRFAYWQPCPVGRARAAETAWSQPIETFYQTLRDCGVARANSSLWFGELEIPETKLTNYQQGQELARRVFGQPKTTWPDAIFVADDIMTTGVLAALDEIGIVPGRELQIVTQANKGSAVLAGRSPLTLLEDDPGALVDALFSSLDRLMDGRKTLPVFALDSRHIAHRLTRYAIVIFRLEQLQASPFGTAVNAIEYSIVPRSHFSPFIMKKTFILGLNAAFLLAGCAPSPAQKKQRGSGFDSNAKLRCDFGHFIR